MAYNPTPNDPSAQEGAFYPDEPPTNRADYPTDETPTRQRPRPPQNVPPPQPPGYPPPQQEGYPPAQPGSYPPAPQGYPQQTQPAAVPAGAAGAATLLGSQKIWGDLAQLGQAAGIAGALLVIFFFLPWSFTPDIRASTTQITSNFPTVSHSGWSTAVGIPLLGGTVQFTLFPHLWLVLLCALALIATAALLRLYRIGVRLAAMLITGLSLLALVLELLFLAQINSFQGAINALAGGNLNQTLYGVSWGFWLALVATIVALGIGAYMLYQEYAPGARRTPQAPRFPEGQQPHPMA